jgi:hypothetical protein
MIHDFTPTEEGKHPTVTKVVREHRNHETDYGAMEWKTDYYVWPNGTESRGGFHGRWRVRPDAELMPMWSRERLSNEQWSHE